MSNVLPLGTTGIALNPQQLAQVQTAQQKLMPKPFKINGKEMELKEFVETLYPHDCPERTYLLLKLTKGEEDEE